MRVLEAFGEPISHGGEEIFVCDFVDNMNTEQLTVDFLTPYYCDNSKIRARVEAKGGSVYALNRRFNPGGARLNADKSIHDFLRANHYDVIHVHSGSISMLAMYSRIAHRLGIDKIILHAHCAGINNIRHSVSRLLNSVWLNDNRNLCCACSTNAGRWMFSRSVCDQRLRVINNGIDCGRFAYNSKARSRVRSELGIEDSCLLLGSVGRLCKSKNQDYLLKLMPGLLSQTDCRLLLVGNGESRAALENSARELGIADRVIFAGAVDNPEDYYQAMDVFVLPTLFEGFSLVIIEAQAGGLATIVSDCISRDTDISGETIYLPLTNEAAWCDAILNCRSIRGDYSQQISDRGYNIRDIAGEIEKIYTNELNG